MKLVVMQNNGDQQWDAFIRGKLENTAPDMTLLESSLAVFLLEKKEKEKTKRRYIWLFLLTALMLIPVTYIIVAGDTDTTQPNRDDNKNETAMEAKKTGRPMNTRDLGPAHLIKKTSVQKKTGKLVLVEINKQNTDGKEIKLRQAGLNNRHIQTPSKNRQDKEVAKDTAEHPMMAPAKIAGKPADNLLDKKEKTVNRSDTLYIVW